MYSYAKYLSQKPWFIGMQLTIWN